MTKMYRLYDLYDGDMELIYEANNIADITKYARYYDADVVDGECFLTVYEVSNNGSYDEKKGWCY